MSLRSRLALSVALLVAIAIGLSGGLTVLNAQGELRDEVDDFLTDRAGQLVPFASGLERLAGRPGGPGREIGRDLLDRPDAVTQLIAADGTVLVGGDPLLPVGDDDLRIAGAGVEGPVGSDGDAGDRRPLLRTVEVDDERYRVVTAPVRSGGALMIARDLAEVDDVVSGLARRTVVSSIVGAGLAALVAWALASRLSRPIGRLTAAAAHVAATQDLSATIPTSGDDEVGRLGKSFNTMLEALDTSRRQQQRLVMDASHELRTPLTSLRTNVDLLRRGADHDPAIRAEILADVGGELDELTALVGELVELATASRRPDEPVETMSLADVARVVADRAGRRSSRTIEVVSTDPAAVTGRRSLLERALANLVDNALKFSPVDTPVTVTVTGTQVSVRDHGPGIAAEDLPHVFDRFYRAVATRSTPGSGLGLAIVHDVVTDHGGEVFAGPAADGGPGAVVGFRLPTTAGGSGQR